MGRLSPAVLLILAGALAGCGTTGITPAASTGMEGNSAVHGTEQGLAAAPAGVTGGTATRSPTAMSTPAVIGPPPDGVADPRPAPEVTDEVWLNGERTSLAALRQQGKVVLVEFWTFECYNCRNVLPALRRWHTAYTADGLTIVGVHYPEFDTERQIPNVRQALKDLDIKYLVTIDNDGRTWQAYHQNAWPSLYLIDKKGNIRYQHVGEGAYERTEQWIQYLLHERA